MRLLKSKSFRDELRSRRLKRFHKKAFVKFAYIPTIMSDGSVIWLEKYFKLSNVSLVRGYYKRFSSCYLISVRDALEDFSPERHPPLCTIYKIFGTEATLLDWLEDRRKTLKEREIYKWFRNI